MKPILVEPPATDPVTLEDVKAHLRVFFDDDNSYIESLIKAATSYLDGYQGVLNRCIVTQSWQSTHCRFCRKMEAPFTDMSAAVVKYYDVTGALQTVDVTSYNVYPDYIRFDNAFSPPSLDSDRDDAIQIISTHGYAEDQVPASLLLAIKILVAHWYRNREPVAFGVNPAKIPHTIDMLIAPHRWAF